MDTQEAKTLALLDEIMAYTIDQELRRLVLLEKAYVTASQRRGESAPWRVRVVFQIEAGPIRR